MVRPPNEPSGAVFLLFALYVVIGIAFFFGILYLAYTCAGNPL
jgi:hypothetical protein